jgi:hypothetical protein
MARARTDWTVCRLAPDVAGRVEYLVDIRLSDARWLGSPVVSADRADAWTGHRQGADAVADILNLHGGGSEDRGAWTALPAVIHAPSPYQPQEKGVEERRRGATAEDIGALRAAISGSVVFQVADLHGAAIDKGATAAMQLIAAAESASAALAELVQARFADPEEGWAYLLFVLCTELGGNSGEVPHGCS